GLSESLRRRNTGDQAGTVPLVVAHPVDVDVVRFVGRVVDLEADGLALVDADVGCESLDGRVPASRHAPGALRRPRQLILGGDARGHRAIFQLLHAQPRRGSAPRGSPFLAAQARSDSSLHGGLRIMSHWSRAITEKWLGLAVPGAGDKPRDRHGVFGGCRTPEPKRDVTGALATRRLLNRLAGKLREKSLGMA